jgi:ribosome-associated translation inhibitor RaiA
MAKTQPILPSNLHIGGDTLALDSALRRLIITEARAIQDRFPDQTVALRVRIGEEFDPAKGHQVRCEVVASLAERRQLVVREFRKHPREAIIEAFASAKSQIRRLRRRSILPAAASVAPLNVAGL